MTKVKIDIERHFSNHFPVTLFLSDQKKKLLRYAEILTDFFAFFFSITIGYGLYTVLMNRPLPEGVFYYVQLGFFAGIVGIMTFHLTGLYYHQASIMNLLETRKLIHTTSLLFLLFILYSFFAKAPYSRVTLCLAFSLLIPMLIIGRFIFFKINQYLFLNGIGVRNVLIFGAGATGRLLFQSISHTPKLGYQPLGFFDTDGADKKRLRDLLAHDNSREILLLTSFDKCLQRIEENGIQDIFLSKPLYQDQGGQLQKLLSLCREHQIRLHSVPYLQPLFTEQVVLNNINGIPLVSFRDIPVNMLERITKRCFDLIVTTLLLIVLSPILMILSLLVKIDSKGPLLFKQKRIGKNSIPFTMYKFRTMFNDTPDFQNSPTMADDPRITRVGRLLRKTSLDELPQIFNVLQGTMSLVGPRPEMEFIVENEYNDLYRQRLCVKPGITGIWQISTDRTRKIHEDISYDLFYIANRSLLLDILIILRTLPALFSMRTC